MDRYLSGREVYGEDFSQEEIDAWFEDEREAYANLDASFESGAEGEGYGYHALNDWHAFRHLPRRHYANALGVGSAHGEEFAPLAATIGTLTILEPSDQLVGTDIGGLTPKYVKPEASGDMPFGDGAFDLILCLGTLHHIPNVSHVLGEMGRVAAPGAVVVIREPIVSMGDWRHPRPGLTARERGIPQRALLAAVRAAGLDVAHISY